MLFRSGLAAPGQRSRQALEVSALGGHVLEGLCAGLVHLRGLDVASLRGVRDVRQMVAGHAVEGNLTQHGDIGGFEAFPGDQAPVDEVVVEGGGALELGRGRLVVLVSFGELPLADLPHFEIIWNITSACYVSYGSHQGRI